MARYKIFYLFVLSGMLVTSASRLWAQNFDTVPKTIDRGQGLGLQRASPSVCGSYPFCRGEFHTSDHINACGVAYEAGAEWALNSRLSNANQLAGRNFSTWNIYKKALTEHLKFNRNINQSDIDDAFHRGWVAGAMCQTRENLKQWKGSHAAGDSDEQSPNVDQGAEQKPGASKTNGSIALPENLGKTAPSQSSSTPVKKQNQGADDSADDDPVSDSYDMQSKPCDVIYLCNRTFAGTATFEFSVQACKSGFKEGFEKAQRAHFLKYESDTKGPGAKLIVKDEILKLSDKYGSWFNNAGGLEMVDEEARRIQSAHLQEVFSIWYLHGLECGCKNNISPLANQLLDAIDDIELDYKKND